MFLLNRNKNGYEYDGRPKDSESKLGAVMVELSPTFVFELNLFY